MIIKNEKGSTLVLVLLIFLVLTTLGLAIASATINSGKRTELREEDITQNLDALRDLKEGVAAVEAYIAKNGANLINLPAKKDYDQAIADFITNKNSSNNKQYQIEDKTTDHSSYTKTLEISSSAYSQKVYITATPSFLKYALGSRESLTLNGSPLIEGDIYSNKTLSISNDANYIYNSVPASENTLLPAIKTSSKIHLGDKNQPISLCSSGKANNCYNPKSTPDNLPVFEKNNPYWQNLSIQNLDQAFSSDRKPLYEDETAEFIDVDIHQSFIEKLNVAGFSPQALQGNTDDEKKLFIRNQIKAGQSNLGIRKISDFKSIGKDLTSTAFLYSGEARVDVDEIKLQDHQWLIIDGDLFLESVGNKSMNVKGNILVTGNISIVGNLSFNSVIYALGDTTLNNINITCYQNSCDEGNSGEVLILMTQGHLEVFIINSFKEEADQINGYLYTASEANIYAVGSLLSVEGGIFSKDNLVVNSYRGSAKAKTNGIDFTPALNMEDSRLQITNNKRLFLNQTQGLPKVNGLEVITDRIEKN